MKRIHVLAVAALALGLQGCNTLYAEAEQPRVCLTLPTQSVTIPGGGLPVPPGGITATYSQDIDLDLAGVLPDFLMGGPPSDRVLHFLSFEADVGMPGENLDIISDLEVSATGGAGATPVTLGAYTHPQGTNVTRILIDSSAPDANLADYLGTGGLNLHLAGTVSIPQSFGTVPTTWSARVSACFSAKVHKTLQQVIDGG